MNKCCPNVFFAAIVISFAFVITIANVYIEANGDDELEQGSHPFHPFLLNLERIPKISSSTFTEELKLYKHVYPSGSGNQDLDFQLDELIELAQINMSKCNGKYNEQLKLIFEKYFSLSKQSAGYVTTCIEEQLDLCKQSIRHLIHEAVASLSEGEKLAISKLTRKVGPTTVAYVRDPKVNLARGIVALLNEEYGDKIKELSDLSPSEGVEALKKLFDSTINDLCQKIVDEFAFPAGVLSTRYESSLFIEEWVINYNLCKDIRFEVELPESPLIQACFEQL